MSQQVNINPIGENSLLGKMFDNAGIQHGAPKKSWEELDSVYWAMANSVVETGSNVNSAIRQINYNTIPNIDEIIVTVDGLKRDLEDITQTLVAIRSRYLGKTGVVKDEQENNLCIDCFTDYQELADRQRMLIIQPLMTITEALANIGAEKPVEFTANGDIVGEAVEVKD